MISLRPMTYDDLPLFQKWLRTAHVAKWYHDPGDRVTEVEQQDVEYNWIYHFIAELDGIPVGFCQYYAGLDSGEEWLDGLGLDGTYSIDYLIGEADNLRRGYGKQIIERLTEEILRHEDAKRIAVQPKKENAASRALLLSCGFTLIDGEKGIYVKELRQ